MADLEFDEKLSQVFTQPPAQGHNELKALHRSWSPSRTSVKILADTCRNEEWRIPIAEAGFLSSVLKLDILKIADKDVETAIQVMRFIGNAVAYCDENRAVVLPYMSTILKVENKENDQLRLTALSALLNLCIDYEPAQISFVEQGLFKTFSIGTRTYPRPIVHTILSLVNVIFPVFNARDETLPSALLSWAFLETSRAPGIVNDQQEDFLRCTDSLVPLLRDEGIQRSLATNIGQVLQLLENTVVRLSGRRRAIGEADPDEDEIAELESCADELVGAVANVAFHWTFESKAQLLADEDFKDAQRWLAEEWQTTDQVGARRSEDNIRFARAAALVLGNVAMKGWIAETLVQETNIVATAIKVVSETKDRELLNASAGLLRNLAIPPSTKDALHAAGAFAAVTKLIAPTNEQQRHEHDKDGAPQSAVPTGKDTAQKVDVELTTAGLRLLHVLLLDSPTNCRLLLSRTSDSGSHEALISLLRDNKDLDARLSAEAGRTIVALLRTFAITPAFRAEMHKTHRQKALIDETDEAVRAVFTLTAHPDPRNKSIGWMGLGLMSRTTAGAEAMYSLFGSGGDFAALFQELFQASAGSDRPMLARDQDNALVVMANLKNEMGGRMMTQDVTALQDLLSRHGRR